MIKKFFQGFLLALVSIFLNYCSDNSQEAEKIAELYAHYDDNFKAFLSQAQQEMGKEIIKYEIIDTDLLPKKVTITGNHYELGYLIGLIGKKYNHLLIRPTSPNQEINQKIIQMYQNIYPQYLEKARGVAEAYGLTIDDIDFRYLEHDFYTGLWCRLFRYPEFVNLTGFSSSNTNCSVVSYFLETQNRHIIGRNFDNQSERPHFLVITKLDGVYKTIGMPVMHCITGYLMELMNKGCLSVWLQMKILQNISIIGTIDTLINRQFRLSICIESF